MYTVSKLFHFVLNFQQTEMVATVYMYRYMAGVAKHWMQTDAHVSVHVSQVSVLESLLNAFKE